MLYEPDDDSVVARQDRLCLQFNHPRLRVLLETWGRQIRDEPAAWLWLAVLGQAVFDAHLSTGMSEEVVRARADARQFLASDRLDAITDSIGLSPQWVRLCLARFAAIVKRERRTWRAKKRRTLLASR